MNTAPPAFWRELPGLIADADGPVFAEPWQAQAFAMAVQLHQRGVFTWPEWAATLAGQIRRAGERGEAGSGDRYYHHWLAALEEIVAAKGAGSPDELARTRHAWEHAAERTAHGRPIELRRSDFDD